MNKEQIKKYREKIVNARQRILSRLTDEMAKGSVSEASVDRAEIELLEAKIALEECS